MIKFRSMRHGEDDQAHRELMKKMINGEDVNQGTDEEPIFGKIKDDPRRTKIGSWMRRYSIDELPQMLNVLMGQMSIESQTAFRPTGLRTVRGLLSQISIPLLLLSSWSILTEPIACD